MKRHDGFNLFNVIIIVLVTAIVSSIATGIIMLNNNTNTQYVTQTIENDPELEEFVKVYKTLNDKYYDKVDKKGMLNAAEEAMASFLNDKYTTYLDNNEYNGIMDELSGTYDGIGITIENNKVISIMSSSPADKAGIKVGDIIVLINDASVEELDSSEISSIIKNTNETIDIGVKRNDELLHFLVQKEELVFPTTKYEIVDNTSIGYIYIKNFSKNLKTQVEQALNYLELKNINSLIIDVRDNAGGYLSAAEETASLFIENGRVIYSLESNNRNYTYKDTTKESRKYKIVVLINGGSASASEILAAALKDSYGAILVGTKSYGKGKVQQVVPLSSGGSVKYTSAKWLTPSGKCIDGIGLYPDYNVTYSIDGSYDSQISKAIELLS